jgi:outer membrane protein assembly factor BamD (BamD/ComL family)
LNLNYGITSQKGVIGYSFKLKDKAAVKQNAKKTLAVWSKVITQFPDSKYVPIGYYFSAKVYTRLGDYPAAIKYNEIR